MHAAKRTVGSSHEHHAMRNAMMIYVLGALAIAGAMCASVAPAGAQATPANDHATTTYVAHLRALALAAWRLTCWNTIALTNASQSVG